MIAVVHLFQFCHLFFIADASCLGQHLDVGAQLSGQLFLADTAEGLVCWLRQSRARVKRKSPSDFNLVESLSRLGRMSKLDGSCCSIGSDFAEAKPFFERQLKERFLILVASLKIFQNLIQNLFGP